MFVAAIVEFEEEKKEGSLEINFIASSVVSVPLLTRSRICERLLELRQQRCIQGRILICRRCSNAPVFRKAVWIITLCALVMADQPYNLLLLGANRLFIFTGIVDEWTDHWPIALLRVACWPRRTSKHHSDDTESVGIHGIDESCQ